MDKKNDVFTRVALVIIIITTATSLVVNLLR